VSFGQAYSVPQKLPIERLVHRTFPAYFGGAKFPQLIAERFFPIGWSRDGKFAYYTEPVDEACGCYFANLVIQDMRTDTVLWKFKYTQDDINDNGKRAPEDNINKLWKKNQKLFSEKLAENGIVASPFAMLGKTFANTGSSFTAKSRIKMGKNPDGGEDRVNKFTITLASAKLGSKTVYLADYTKEEYWFMLDAGLIGVLKSPYENRVAILTIEVMKGYEGPPHTADIRLVGADLTSGFERDK
jgi:hypothetical protein